MVPLVLLLSLFYLNLLHFSCCSVPPPLASLQSGRNLFLHELLVWIIIWQSFVSVPCYLVNFNPVCLSMVRHWLLISGSQLGMIFTSLLPLVAPGSGYSPICCCLFPRCRPTSYLTHTRGSSLHMLDKAFFGFPVLGPSLCPQDT